MEAERLASLPPAGRKAWPTVANFYDEFTDAEQYAIQSSSIPAVLIAKGKLAMWRGEVWSDDERILIGLDTLLTSEILSQPRITEILS